MDGTIREVKVHKSIISAHCSVHPFDMEQLSFNINITVIPTSYSGHPYPTLSAHVLASW
jgi:hypothetical protein